MIRFLLNLSLTILISSSCALKPVVQKTKNRKTPMLAQVRATVVIDAGHGGEDSGALGKSGLKEKDLCLDIALRAKRLIKLVMPQVKIIMTRESDHAIALEERIKIANNAKADLFISIHVNSSDSPSAKGFEIYSLDIASDKHAERLAQRENMDLSAHAKNRVKFILADLRANDFRSESDQLARSISQSLSSQLSKKVSNFDSNNRGFNQAIFQVLFVKMPAVLAELFFISNPEEERLLKTENMRESCARGIVAGIGKYLDQRIVRARNARKDT